VIGESCVQEDTYGVTGAWLSHVVVHKLMRKTIWLVGAGHKSCECVGVFNRSCAQIEKHAKCGWLRLCSRGQAWCHGGLGLSRGCAQVDAQDHTAGG
jgi:hypothetical protein